MKIIKNLIKNKNLNINQRNKINNILYLSHEKIAIKKAIEFKKYHINKCQNIHLDELIFSSKIGLYKSILKYNGNYSFINYSNIYIKSNLLQTLTSYYTLSNIPKNIRIKNKSKLSKNELIIYNKNIKLNLINYQENWKLDKLYNTQKFDILNNYIVNEEKNNKLIHIWNEINKLEPFSKRIFYLKYDYQFNVIRSNTKISYLMCCSEENIRKYLIYSISLLNDKLNNTLNTTLNTTLNSIG